MTNPERNPDPAAAGTSGPTAGLSQRMHHPAPISPSEPLGYAPGSVIGPYKLLQLIGEGGFGSVFMAEQTDPVRRRVALKIIKLGMDTRQVIARFEAERQALAIMDHPHIARVLDAGATDTGRPYFVMELVKGVPFTRYADQRWQPRRRGEVNRGTAACRTVPRARLAVEL